MNIVRIRVFRSRPLSVRLAALALIALALAAPVGASKGVGIAAPDLGECAESLAVPAKNRIISHVYARGVQIYRWDGMTWVFVAPKAVLFDDAEWNDPVGIHYAGPTWEDFGGSKVVGRVVERCTPDTDTIPWLLLEAVYNESHGPLGRVTFIHRVNTTGGKAPAEPGSASGQLARVPYTAEYYFYKRTR
jgi:hypothetical protein